MYCSQCGAELPETAQFCSQCGASTVAAPAASDGDAPHAEDVLPPAPTDGRGDDTVACAGGPSMPGEAHADEPSAADSVSEGKQTLGQRLLLFRRTTLKAVPTFVLALVAFMATVATAYAAFKVVTEVIIPAIEQVVEQGQDGSASAADGVATSDEGEAVVAKGNPTSILQIGEILAMEPEDISAFLESQGLVYMDDVQQWVLGDDTDKMFGALKDEGLYFENSDRGYRSGVEAYREALQDVMTDDKGRLVNRVDGSALVSYLPAISVGKDVLWWNHIDYGEQYGRSALTDGGERPTSIRLYGIPLSFAQGDEKGGAGGRSAGFSDETVVEVCADIMGLGEPSVIYRPGVFVPSINPDGTQGNAMAMTETYASGTVEIRDEQYIWYFAYAGVPAYMNAETGILPFDVARDAVLRSGLYTADEWKAADEAHRSGMFVQALATERLVGDGYTVRRNYRTGAYEGMERITGPDGEIHYSEMNDELLHQYGFDSFEEMEENQQKLTEGTIVDFTKEGVR